MKKREFELESENTSLRKQARSSQEKVREMIEKQKLSSQEDMRPCYNDQIEVLQKEKQMLEEMWASGKAPWKVWEKEPVTAG